MYYLNGRVYRKNGPNSFGMLCPDDDFCREISNAEFVEKVLGKTLSEEDRRLHPTDSAIACCANTYRGTEYVVPDDPYKRMECKLPGSDEIVGYQRGVKCDKVKPRKTYNEHAEYEENVNRFNDEL
uniref:Uncharacterized protein n=1 Tax=Plectus sambesii TaxID=2011161 RepID=A0A914VAN8_9BILA